MTWIHQHCLTEHTYNARAFPQKHRVSNDCRQEPEIVTILNAKQITPEQAADLIEGSEKTSEVRADGLIARTLKNAAGATSVLVQGLTGFLHIEGDGFARIA